MYIDVTCRAALVKCARCVDNCNRKVLCTPSQLSASDQAVRRFKPAQLGFVLRPHGQSRDSRGRNKPEDVTASSVALMQLGGGTAKCVHPGVERVIPRLDERRS